jgi:hypothetical protein
MWLCRHQENLKLKGLSFAAQLSQLLGNFADSVGNPSVIPAADNGAIAPLLDTAPAT